MRILLLLLLVSLPFQLGRHFWLKESFIFGLKVDYLSPALYFQDILIFFLIIFERKEIFLFLKSHWKLVIGYWSLVITNIVFALTPLLSSFAWIRISEFVLLGLVVSQNRGKIINLLGKVLPGTVIFELVLGLFQLLKQSSLGGIFWFFGERTFNIMTPGIARGIWLGRIFLRPYGTFSHPNSLAGFILIAIILIAGKKSLSLFDKLAIFCSSLLIILCFSRTVWLTSVVLGICFVLNRIFLSFKTEKTSLTFFYNRFARTPELSSGGADKARFQASSETNSKAGRQTSQPRLTVAVESLRKKTLGFQPKEAYYFSLSVIIIFAFLFTKTTMEASSFENRIILAKQAFSTLKNRPFFGVGANNFIISLASGNTAWKWYYWLQPVHNIFLLAASETGLVGLAVFIIFLFLTVKNLFSQKFSSSFYLLTSIFCILFTGLFDHYWLTLIQNQLLLAVILGLSWSSENAKIS